MVPMAALEAVQRLLSSLTDVMLQAVAAAIE